MTGELIGTPVKRLFYTMMISQYHNDKHMSKLEHTLAKTRTMSLITPDTFNVAGSMPGEECSLMKIRQDV